MEASCAWFLDAAWQCIYGPPVNNMGGDDDGPLVIVMGNTPRDAQPWIAHFVPWSCMCVNLRMPVLTSPEEFMAFGRREVERAYAVLGRSDSPLIIVADSYAGLGTVMSLCMRYKSEIPMLVITTADMPTPSNVTPTLASTVRSLIVRELGRENTLIYSSSQHDFMSLASMEAKQWFQSKMTPP